MGYYRVNTLPDYNSRSGNEPHPVRPRHVAVYDYGHYIGHL